MTPQKKRPERFDGHRFAQVIPEPDDVVPGAPAPWAALPASQRSGLTLRVVAESLARAHRLLATNQPPDQPEELVADASPTPTPTPIMRRSAVLAALFEEEGEAHVILTRRALSLRRHRGEIALPGGLSEEGESATATALREAKEEIGLEPELVRPTAWLSPIVTFASGSAIWPIVGVLRHAPPLHINPDEVDKVFSVSLTALAAEDAFVEERWRRAAPRLGADEDGYFPIHFFRVPEDVIWGATARVLTELLCLVLGVDHPGNHGLSAYPP